MIDEDIGIPGVTVRRRPDLPARLEGGVQVGPYSSARPGQLLRVVPSVGRFMASEGTRLDYWLEEGADPAAVEALLRGGVLGALIQQRDELPLHATTLVAPGRPFALALAGASGAGKSTTAYELLRRGWTMLSDDLTRVTIEGEVPIAWPGRSQLRLLPDACRRFGLNPADLAPAPKGVGKYVLQLERHETPIALSSLIELQPGEGAAALDAVTGAAAVRALLRQTYRPHYLKALGRTADHFALVAACARRVRVLKLPGRSSVQEVASLVASAAQD